MHTQLSENLLRKKRPNVDNSVCGCVRKRWIANARPFNIVLPAFSHRTIRNRAFVFAICIPLSRGVRVNPQMMIWFEMETKKLMFASNEMFRIFWNLWFFECFYRVMNREVKYGWYWLISTEYRLYTAINTLLMRDGFSFGWFYPTEFRSDWQISQ